MYPLPEAYPQSPEDHDDHDELGLLLPAVAASNSAILRAGAGGNNSIYNWIPKNMFFETTHNL